MSEEQTTDEELVRTVKEGLGDYYDPRLPALVLMLARKGLFTIEDVKRMIECDEEAVIT